MLCAQGRADGGGILNRAHAARVAGPSRFVSPGEGRQWPKPRRSACGQSEPRGEHVVAESAMVRMRPECQEWH